MSGEFCKQCGGYKVDCPQHTLCPNQSQADWARKIAQAQAGVDLLKQLQAATPSS